MSMLAAPDELTPADLDEARAYSTGRIYRLHRVTVCPPCNGMCNQGRDCNAESCATEGGMHADPVPSGTHRQSLLSRAWLRLVRWMA